MLCVQIRPAAVLNKTIGQQISAIIGISHGANRIVRTNALAHTANATSTVEVGDLLDNEDCALMVERFGLIHFRYRDQLARDVLNFYCLQLITSKLLSMTTTSRSSDFRTVCSENFFDDRAHDDFIVRHPNCLCKPPINF